MFTKGGGPVALNRGEKGVLAVALAGLAVMLGIFGLRSLPGRPLEAIPPGAVPSEPADAPLTGGLIDINTAGPETLTELPGIGETRAAAIIAYREEHGPFRYPEELLNVKGIGEGVLEGLLDYVTTGG